MYVERSYLDALAEVICIASGASGKRADRK